MQAKDSYVSNELTHFVGKGKTRQEQYEILRKVLRTGWLTHPPHLEQHSLGTKIFRNRSFSNNQMLHPEMVCFCDIARPHLRIHTEKYSRFGIAFPKLWMIIQGANPVQYVAKGSQALVRRKKMLRFLGERMPVEKAKALEQLPVNIEDYEPKGRAKLCDEYLAEFWELFDENARAQKSIDAATSQIAAKEMQFKMFLLVQVFGFVKVFDETLEEDDPDNYYMEREWRRLGNLKFTSKDVSAVLVPEEMVGQAQEELPEFREQIEGIPG